MSEIFTKENRVKLFYQIADSLPAHEYREQVASLPVLDELLRKRFGRLELAPGYYEIDEVIQNFILAAPESELLDLIELAPIAHYGAMMRAYGRGTGASDLADHGAENIAKDLNRFLEKVVEHPARFVFEPDFRLLRTGLAMQSAAHFSRLPNREKLEQELERLLSTDETVAVVYIDLDHFKDVNDTLGHAAGDECLDKAVALMSSAILKKGNLYRPGGDEFVVVMPNFTAAEAGATAERIRAAIEQGKPGGSVRVTTSIGVVDSHITRNAKQLIIMADKAMYESKEQRNRITIREKA